MPAIRPGSRVRKHYDTARTPFERLLDQDVLLLPARIVLEEQRESLSPLALHKKLEDLIAQGPPEAYDKAAPNI
ncbi:MAG: hypothetical protein ACOYEN_07675 [Limnochordia bacterium]